MSGRLSLAELKRRRDMAAEEFSAVEGISGWGVGDGCINVYAASEAAADKVPDSVQGVQVRKIIASPFEAG